MKYEVRVHGSKQVFEIEAPAGLHPHQLLVVKGATPSRGQPTGYIHTRSIDDLIELLAKDLEILPTLVGSLYPPIVQNEIDAIKATLETRLKLATVFGWSDSALKIVTALHKAGLSPSPQELGML